MGILPLRGDFERIDLHDVDFFLNRIYIVWRIQENFTEGNSGSLKPRHNFRKKKSRSLSVPVCDLSGEWDVSYADVN